MVTATPHKMPIPDPQSIKPISERPITMPVVITGIHVSFGNAIGTCLKWGLAALIAGFMLGLLGIPLWFILGIIFAA